MKYYFMAGLLVLAGLIAVFTQKDNDDSQYAHKRLIVEAETKVRPAHFEEMKWKEGAEVQMRAPASKE